MKHPLFTIIFTLFMGIQAVMAEDISFSATVYIKASKSRVWEGLTDPQTVSRYFMCPMIRIGNKNGDPIEYGVGKDVLISGKIVKFLPNESLSYTFIFDPISHKGTENDAASLVTIDIKEDEGLTVLNLLHNGFKEKDQTYSNVTGGWPWIISNLKTYLETGKTLNEK
jgi:uncharacterized protein YndB with AHSA1/START domain